MKRILLLSLASAGAAWGQFELYLVNGNIEQPVVKAYALGNVEPGSSLAVPFRIRNTSTAAATLDLLAVNGAGFSLSKAGAPTIPAVLSPQQAVDFTVVFQSAGTGSYSASLLSVGISVILSAVVPVELNCQLLTGAGVAPCGGAPITFGSVPRGTSATRQIVLLNQTNTVLVAPGPLLTGDGFSLSGPSPGGTLMQPTDSVSFIIQFTPSTDGPATGGLSLDSRSYVLTATGVPPPLPQPRITISLSQAASAQQGTVAVHLDAAAQSSGSGTVTLTFAPAATVARAPSDPGVVFASGSQSAAFTVAPGDTDGHFGGSLSLPFATGTTAGILTVAVQLGGLGDQQYVTILPATVGVTAAQGVRATGAVEVDLTGFDNTRTAGALSFTFFDAAGNPLGAPVQADGSATFSSYFQNSAGGTFALKAVFPVAGDPTRIAAFQAMVTNSAGTATTARNSF